MIALALAAFVWAVAGEALFSGLGVLVALAWTGADVALDRAEVAGTAAAVVVVSSVAVVCLAGAWLLAARRESSPRRGILVAAGAVAAALAGLMGRIESPSDTETGLVISGFLAGVLGTVAALGCASTLLPGGRVLTLIAGGVGVGLVLGMRAAGPGALSVALAVALAGLLLTVLMVRLQGGAGWILSGVACGVALLLVGTLAVMFSVALPLGDLLTALAGSPPVHAADTDILYTAVAVATGLGVGLLMPGTTRLRKPA